MPEYLNIDKHSMICLIQWLVTFGFQWNLKRKFSLAIRRKHSSHLNLTQFISQAESKCFIDVKLNNFFPGDG